MPQPNHGLHSVEPLVHGKDLLPHLPHHVVPLDLPSSPDRSAIEPGVEVPVADQLVQFAVGDIGGDFGVVFLGGSEQ